MKTSEILIEIAKCKENGDYEDFEKLFNSLNLIELTNLHVFSIKLKKSCENRIANHIK